MARDAMRQVQAFQWQQRPDEPEERDIAVDPFSLRQFSRLDIDRPLPIPSVSVADPHASPAPLGRSSSPVVSAASSPRVSIAGRLNALAEATGWDDARSASPAQKALPRGENKSSAVGGGETELAADDGGFDVALSSSPGRKPGEPQRWASDVPLIAAEEDSAGYSFPKARGKSGRGKARDDAPFRCCMYVPGMSRRAKPPTTPAPALPRSSSGASISRAAATAETQQLQYADLPGTARQSTVSLAVSLERFDCGSLSTSSWGDLDLDGEVSSSTYFDLPLELVLSNGGDDDEADLPVCAAFVFDSDVIAKSVLKKRLGDGVGEAPRPSLGKVSSMDASGRISAARAPASLKSRAPPLAPESP